jgi:hypothetical protein
MMAGQNTGAEATPLKSTREFLAGPSSTKIIALNGAVVEDCSFRTGKRVLPIDVEVSTDGTKTFKTKLKKRDRKDSVA